MSISAPLCVYDIDVASLEGNLRSAIVHMTRSELKLCLELGDD